jgi:uncharacterized protein YutE (UPF0331/DUF86 family)
MKKIIQHTPGELLKTAQELLDSGKPELYRAAILEAITALESLVHVTVFGALEGRFDPLFVEWLRDKTRFDFDSRLSPLTQVATGLPILKDSKLWDRYKKAKELRNQVTHSGRKVTLEEARTVLSTIFEWMDYIQQSAQQDFVRADLLVKAEFFESWAQLEQLLHSSLDLLGKSHGAAYNKASAVNALLDQNRIDNQTAALILRFTELRNKFVHGITINIDMKTVDELNGVVKKLRVILDQNDSE